MEYQVLQASGLPNAANLEEQSAAGWRFVQIVLFGGLVYVYFERPRQVTAG